MANLQSTCVIGTFTVGTSSNTSSPGYIWFGTDGKLSYSYCTGASVGICTP